MLLTRYLECQERSQSMRIILIHSWYSFYLLLCLTMVASGFSSLTIRIFRCFYTIANSSSQFIIVLNYNSFKTPTLFAECVIHSLNQLLCSLAFLSFINEHRHNCKWKWKWEWKTATQKHKTWVFRSFFGKSQLITHPTQTAYYVLYGVVVGVYAPCHYRSLSVCVANEILITLQTTLYNIASSLQLYPWM